MVFTAIAAFFDLLTKLPSIISDSSFVTNILALPNRFLPGFSLGFGWILLAIIGFVIGFVIDKKDNKSKIIDNAGN